MVTVTTQRIAPTYVARTLFPICDSPLYDYESADFSTYKDAIFIYKDAINKYKDAIFIYKDVICRMEGTLHMGKGHFVHGEELLCTSEKALSTARRPLRGGTKVGTSDEARAFVLAEPLLFTTFAVDEKKRIMKVKAVWKTHAEVRARVRSAVLLICIAAAFMACNHRPSADSNAPLRDGDYSLDTHYNNRSGTYNNSSGAYNNRSGAYESSTYNENAASNENSATSNENSVSGKSSPSPNDPSVSAPATNASSTSTPDDAYRKGYSNGYDVGIEDGEYGHSREFNYDDNCHYSGRDKSRYQNGYEQGYEDGYNEGHYNYEHHRETGDW